MTNKLPPVPLEMAAITIHQPWATLIVHGHKRFETRHWKPGTFYGWTAIHAAKREPEKLHSFSDYLLGSGYTRWAQVPLGAVLGWGFLKTAHSTDNPNFLSKLTSKERDLGDFGPGRYAWEFEAVFRLHEPIPARGYQMLWRWQRDDVDYAGVWL